MSLNYFCSLKYHNILKTHTDMLGIGRDNVKRQLSRYCMRVASLSEAQFAAVTNCCLLSREAEEVGENCPAIPSPLPPTLCRRRITDTTKLRCCCSSIHSWKNCHFVTAICCENLKIFYKVQQKGNDCVTR